MRIFATLLCILVLTPCTIAVAQPDPGFGGIVSTFPVELAAGKRIKFSGYIMTEKVRGYAGLWWRADKDSTKAVAFDNMYNRGPGDNSQWKRYQVQLDMPKDITNINFGVLLQGGGTAWFADLKIEIDKKLYTEDDFDLELTSNRPRGFGIVGAAYERVVDSVRLYNGKPTYRIRR